VRTREEDYAVCQDLGADGQRGLIDVEVRRVKGVSRAIQPSHA
jgi:hypothetical protein